MLREETEGEREEESEKERERELYPGTMVTLLASLIHTFAAVSVAIFFYVFHRGQS